MHFVTGDYHRMTGNHIYDMFMGAPLNPRIGKYLDLKMFSKLEFLGLFYFLIIWIMFQTI